ncbi:MAG TPA: cation-transporting P-type ATPase, partial [Anaerolineae bacterium]|nr:cation-transporting P-type ATPase [Anaerolineae bacterium]
MNLEPLHALRPTDVFKALETFAQGLTTAEAESRLTLYGRNALAEPPAVPQARKFIGHITHPMGLLLLIASGPAFISGHVVLGFIILIVVIFNAVFSYWQEYRAERAIHALKQLLPVYARVIRDGAETKVPADTVVPGDVLVLAEGDNIPADARVVEEYGLRLNNSTLTGEALPARKTADAALRRDVTEVEQPNLVFAGTSVVSGTGRAVVFASGMTTQFGRIANLTQTVEQEPSLIQQQMKRITRMITYFALGLGIIVLFVSTADLNLPALDAIILAVGIIVAVVPEGLLPTVTLSLAIAVRRLAQRGVLVKQLSVMETLGKTSVICTDKSGTLTQNQMTVREVWASDQRLTVSGVGYEPKGEFSAIVSSDLDALLISAALCNNARLTSPTIDHPHWTALGDQTEAALRVMALKGGLDESAINSQFPRVHELPFDARRKRMTTIHRTARGEIAFVKGAPKEVLQLCTQVLTRGKVVPLTEAVRSEIVAANDDYARRALRVLALARRDLPARSGAYTIEKVEQGLTFLGLAAMMDPPRLDVAEAVKTCVGAGIRIVMITGDYGLTAESVARRVGMLTTDRPRIISGADIEAMSDADLQTALEQEVIFARMAPEHKLRVVAAFQARGDVVAVTGDGVNDAPALRKSDIGIAMGITGTDVAKEAADVILTDDRFAAIVSAIEEGRAVYDNLRKFITYIFASNVPEIMPFVMMAIFHIPLALTVAQMLAIDLGTDLLPALALGTEKPEPNVMNRPPRSRSQPVIDRGLLLRAFGWLGVIESALCFAGFLFVYSRLNGDLTLRVDLLPWAQQVALPDGIIYILATTVYHAGVVSAQIGNAFACRTETERVFRLGLFSNRLLLLGVAAEALLIAVMIYVPFVSPWFDHLPLPPVFWLIILINGPIL